MGLGRTIWPAAATRFLFMRLYSSAIIVLVSPDDPKDRMKIGISLPVRELEDDLGAIKEFAQTADELGYTHLRVPDQVLRPNGGHLHEPLMWSQSWRPVAMHWSALDRESERSPS